MGASSNFGNMFSVLGASAFLPYIPMAPIEVLTNNLLYDFSPVPIPTDAVDEEQVTRPRPWNIAEITRFILYIGPISSIFGYTTFFRHALAFRLLGSVTRLIISDRLVRRVADDADAHHPRDSDQQDSVHPEPGQLAVDGDDVMHHRCRNVVAVFPLAPSLGLARLPGLCWPILLLTLLSYMILTQVMKTWLLRKKWI
jgi:P-type Mg2+ transporter